MKKFLFGVLFVLVGQSGGFANDVQFLINDATELLRVTHGVCAGIADEISDIKTLVGVNAGVTAVGAVAGGASVAVGIKKSDIDAEIESLEQEICKKGGCDLDTLEHMSLEDFMEYVAVPLAEISRLQELKE